MKKCPKLRQLLEYKKSLKLKFKPPKSKVSVMPIRSRSSEAYKQYLWIAIKPVHTIIMFIKNTLFRNCLMKRLNHKSLCFYYFFGNYILLLLRQLWNIISLTRGP